MSRIENRIRDLDFENFSLSVCQCHIIVTKVAENVSCAGNDRVFMGKQVR